MSDENSAREHPGWHSASAESAAARWAQKHPDEDIDHPPPPNVPEEEDSVPNRHSASAEAAALRWRQQHPEDGEG